MLNDFTVGFGNHHILCCIADGKILFLCITRALRKVMGSWTPSNLKRLKVSHLNGLQFICLIFLSLALIVVKDDFFDIFLPD